MLKMSKNVFLAKSSRRKWVNVHVCSYNYAEQGGRKNFIDQDLLQLKNYLVSSLQVKESLSIPVVGNGDIKCESDVRNVHQVTGVNGND